MTQEPKPSYRIHQLCWNLSAHYPWWPGIVEQVRRHKEIIIYRVKLIGTDVDYRVYQVQHRMKQYSQMRQMFLDEEKTHGKQFTEALRQAESLYNTQGTIIDIFGGQSKGSKPSVCIASLKNQISNTKDQSTDLIIPEKKNMKQQNKSFFVNQEKRKKSYNRKRRRSISNLKSNQRKNKKQSQGRKIRKTSIQDKSYLQQYLLDPIGLGGKFQTQLSKSSQQQSQKLVKDKQKRGELNKKSQIWKQKVYFIKNFARKLRDKALDMQEKQLIAKKMFERMQSSEMDRKQFASQALKWIQKSDSQAILVNYQSWEPESVFQQQQQEIQLREKCGKDISPKQDQQKLNGFVENYFQLNQQGRRQAKNNSQLSSKEEQRCNKQQTDKGQLKNDEMINSQSQQIIKQQQKDNCNQKQKAINQSPIEYPKCLTNQGQVQVKCKLNKQQTKLVFVKCAEYTFVPIKQSNFELLND